MNIFKHTFLIFAFLTISLQSRAEGYFGVGAAAGERTAFIAEIGGDLPLPAESFNYQLAYINQPTTDESGERLISLGVTYDLVTLGRVTLEVGGSRNWYSISLQDTTFKEQVWSASGAITLNITQSVKLRYSHHEIDSDAISTFDTLTIGFRI